jgi:hypothetical protein
MDGLRKSDMDSLHILPILCENVQQHNKYHEMHVIICDPLTPIFLPKKPEAIEPNKGKIINVKYIIYIVTIISTTTVPTSI